MVRVRKNEKWLIYAFVILLCLVLASFWLMCNIYARYSTAASGGDEARVARFNVTEPMNETRQIEVEVYPGFSQNYKVSVKNESEVAISYVMEVSNPYNNLPLQFQMLDSTGKEISSGNTDISAQDHSEHVYQLNVSWPKQSTDSGNNAMQNPDYAGKTDVIEIRLKAIQKD